MSRRLHETMATCFAIVIFDDRTERVRLHGMQMLDPPPSSFNECKFSVMIVMPTEIALKLQIVENESNLQSTPGLI